MKKSLSIRIAAKEIHFKKFKSLLVPNLDFKIKAMLFVLLGTFSLTAQDANKGWGLEAYYSPQYSNYVSSDFLKNDNFLPVYSYSIGLGFEKNIARHCAINTGFVFQNDREKYGEVLGSSVNAEPFKNQIGDLSPGAAPKSLVEYFTLAIPITTKLFIEKGILRWYCRTGIQPEVQFRMRRIIIHTRNPSNPSQAYPDKIITDFNKVNLSWILGFGMEVNLWNSLFVFVEPEGKLQLLKPDGVFNTKKYLAGLRVGVRGRFGKEL